MTAAPLKHGVRQLVHLGNNAIRGHMTAAPLKPGPSLFRYRSPNNYPRSHDRGPIEAGLLRCIPHPKNIPIRGHMTAAPLKRFP